MKALEELTDALAMINGMLRDGEANSVIFQIGAKIQMAIRLLGGEEE